MKPIEMPIGDNALIIRHKVGNHHVAEHPLSVVREIWRSVTPSSREQIGRPLKRGLFKLVIETHLKNRQLYVDVMSGKVGTSE